VVNFTHLLLYTQGNLPVFTKLYTRTYMYMPTHASPHLKWQTKIQ